MYLADYHVHASCSPDGKFTVEQLAEHAVSIGLDELCITDHVDTYYWKGFTPRDDFPWEKAKADFDRAVERFGDRLKLRLGAELGEAYWSYERMEKILSEAPSLDFLIGSVHMASRRHGQFDLYFIEEADETFYHDVIDGYMEEMAGLVQWGKFDVIGHMTLPLRYINEKHNRTMTFEKHMHQAEEIFRVIIPKGIGIECNTNRGNAILPEAAVLKLYREMGGEIITLGSDAHVPEHIGCQMAQAQELLRSCGFRYFTTYTQRKAEFHPL